MWGREGLLLSCRCFLFREIQILAHNPHFSRLVLIKIVANTLGQDPLYRLQKINGKEVEMVNVKGELRGKNEVILDVWPWNHVSIFDNFIYEQFLAAQIINLKDDQKMQIERRHLENRLHAQRLVSVPFCDVRSSNAIRYLCVFQLCTVFSIAKIYSLSFQYRCCNVCFWVGL